MKSTIHQIYEEYKDIYIVELSSKLQQKGIKDSDGFSILLFTTYSTTVKNGNVAQLLDCILDCCKILGSTANINSPMILCDALCELKFFIPETIEAELRLHFFEKEIPKIDLLLTDIRQKLQNINNSNTALNQATLQNSDQFERELNNLNSRCSRLQALLQTLLNASSDFFIIVFDTTSKIRNFNKTALDKLGYLRTQVVEQEWEYIFPQHIIDSGMLKAIRHEIKESGVWSGDIPLKHCDGSEIYSEFSFTKINSPRGDEWGVVGMGRDISEQRSMQEQLVKYTNDLQQLVEERSLDLEESEELYQHLVEDMNAGYFIVKSGKLIFTNNVFLGICGYSREDLLGTSLLELIIERSRKNAQLWWNRVENSQYTKTVEFIISRKDSTKAVVECKAQAVTLRGQPHIIGMMHDITEKKKMEKQLQSYVNNLEKMVAERTGELENSIGELKSTQFQLVQSQKLAGIGILAAGIAHEINNPLQALQLKSKHILHHIENESEIRRSAQDIIKYVSRMAEIVRGLSKFAHTVKHEDESVAIDLVDVIKESLELSYHTRNFNDIIVKREFEPIESVLGNKGQYQQIFINLIVNAIDAMEGRGRLTLRLAKHSDEMVLMEIEDTGCGIPEENFDKIFTPLFTTKPSGKGTGMGLHVAYRIINKFGGSISVSSVMGKGTKFSLHFPVGDETQANLHNS